VLAVIYVLPGCVFRLEEREGREMPRVKTNSGGARDNSHVSCRGILQNLPPTSNGAETETGRRVACALSLCVLSVSLISATVRNSIAHCTSTAAR